MALEELIKESAGSLTIKNKVAKIDATGMYYRDLNTLLRQLDKNGIENIQVPQRLRTTLLGNGP